MKNSKLTLSGLVFTFDITEFPNCVIDDLFEIKSSFFEVKDIEGPQINGIVAVTIEITRDKAKNFSYFMPFADFSLLIIDKIQTTLLKRSKQQCQ